MASVNTIIKQWKNRFVEVKTFKISSFMRKQNFKVGINNALYPSYLEMHKSNFQVVWL